MSDYYPLVTNMARAMAWHFTDEIMLGVRELNLSGRMDECGVRRLAWLSVEASKTDVDFSRLNTAVEVAFRALCDVVDLDADVIGYEADLHAGRDDMTPEEIEGAMERRIRDLVARWRRSVEPAHMEAAK